MPAVHRNSDSRTDRSSTAVAGQNNVYVNGNLASVLGDPNTARKDPLAATVNPGTVFVNGKELVVVGSLIFGPPVRAATGSPDVFAF